VFEKSLELEATLQHTSQGIVMVDGDRKVRLINPPAIEYLSAAGYVALGLPLPLDIDKLFAGAERAADTAETVEVSFDTGTTISVSRSEMPDDGMLYTLTDITQHKRNEAVMAEARDTAEAGARARASFLATMSHEIRTPLNGVIGMTHLLEDCADADERKTYIDAMRRSADHLQMIIEDILDMSKLEADRMTFEFVALDLHETVRASIGMVEPTAVEKHLGLGVELDAGVPARVMGDPGRLRQILLNLLGNAVKFTSVGSVMLRIDTTTGGLDGTARMLRFCVTDTGIGIDDGDVKKLFRDFTQIDGSITRRFGGTGLGLAISRKLAENMGGTISVASEPGKGSTFTLVMPLVPAKPAVVPSEVGASGTAAMAVGLDVLLAEDSPVNTMVATRMLQNLGHRVTAVVDGIEVMDVLARQRFDVVFMDVMMPRMDGLTATQLIRRSGAPFAEIPIIALTAAALSEDQDKAFAAGVTSFTTKPVSKDRLRAAIEEATGATPRARQAG
jgi:signal transduction histidine kinase/CheY-like chemotaxis protein